MLKVEREAADLVLVTGLEHQHAQFATNVDHIAVQVRCRTVT